MSINRETLRYFMEHVMAKRVFYVKGISRQELCNRYAEQTNRSELPLDEAIELVNILTGLSQEEFPCHWVRAWDDDVPDTDTNMLYFLTTPADVESWAKFMNEIYYIPKDIPFEYDPDYKKHQQARAEKEEHKKALPAFLKSDWVYWKAEDGSYTINSPEQLIARTFAPGDFPEVKTDVEAFNKENEIIASTISFLPQLIDIAEDYRSLALINRDDERAEKADAILSRIGR